MFFKPFRFEYLLKKNVTNLNTSQYRIGIEAILSNKEDAHSLYAYFNYRFKKNYYIYSYSRIVKKPSYFEGFSGNVQETKRFGFEAGETDLAGIGFENENFVVQFGRGRQNWGAGNGIELVLRESSAPYDYGLFDFRFRNFRSRYFHGFFRKY